MLQEEAASINRIGMGAPTRLGRRRFKAASSSLIGCA
jgi:hypothetical protein